MRITESQLRKIIGRVLKEGFVEYDRLSDSELLEYVASGDNLAEEEYNKRVEADPDLCEADDVQMPSHRHRFFEVDKK